MLAILLDAPTRLWVTNKAGSKELGRLQAAVQWVQEHDRGWFLLKIFFSLPTQVSYEHTLLLNFRLCSSKRSAQIHFTRRLR